MLSQESVDRQFKELGFRPSEGDRVNQFYERHTGVGPLDAIIGKYDNHHRQVDLFGFVPGLDTVRVSDTSPKEAMIKLEAKLGIRQDKDYVDRTVRGYLNRNDPPNIC
ncbi:MAG: hypothetical protein A2639_01945 [Candidatus Staskawiczbacteria bacterium RIFCSPHIGHO2_01_FULL_34_27]|uniref:Uncharacterized protein n=1 Tax=Candidatus Staskawiczbacteria bacterium RIFCSPHIGHO2_01_FULL_34_27 TaxID=1802199 RepID=A0A1G2HKQ9_9BACT|nr:MAG: hypothetical protein A2639_01945 [Candidatus Staskawiczbacteria bacterium RIFCSPHIGHO2_01_FULL_34_27]HLC52209.1 hypothetical protein [Candidatus Nanoarchaeia archaeon]